MSKKTANPAIQPPLSHHSPTLEPDGQSLLVEILRTLAGDAILYASNSAACFNGRTLSIASEHRITDGMPSELSWGMYGVANAISLGKQHEGRGLAAALLTPEAHDLLFSHAISNYWFWKIIDAALQGENVMLPVSEASIRTGWRKLRQDHEREAAKNDLATPLRHLSEISQDHLRRMLFLGWVYVDVATKTTCMCGAQTAKILAIKKNPLFTAWDELLHKSDADSKRSAAGIYSPARMEGDADDPDEACSLDCIFGLSPDI